MEQEEFVATLLFPDEYRRHLNQVAGLSSQNITYLRSKFGSISGGDMIQIPVAQCTSIAYRERRPLYVLVIGALLGICAPIIFAYLAWNWNWLPPGTKVPTGGLLVGTVIGFRWVFGARRHELTFALKGHSTLKWKSRPGDFKYK